MAEKKKKAVATKKPTRTGAETKSYTSASSRMQAKGKSGQRSASAAHAGKSGKAGKTAVDSAELRSGLRARNRLTTIGEPKNRPYVFPSRFDQQEDMRNRNKARAIGALASDYRGKDRFNSTEAQTYGGNSPLGAFGRVGSKAVLGLVYAVEKIKNPSGRTSPKPAEILGGRKGPFRDKTFDELGWYNPYSTRQTLRSEFEVTGKDNRRTGGGRRGPENVPPRTGDFYGRQWSAVDSYVIPGAARGDSTQRAENQRNMAKKPVAKKSAPAAKGKKGVN